MAQTVLFLDSATESCTAGVRVDGCIHSRFEIAPRGHAQKLLPMAEAVMAEAGVGYADLDVIGFNRGPGSFTGVRIATGLAQGMAMARDLPLLPISSLQILAQQYQRRKSATDPDWVHVTIDARMREIYYAVFRLEQGKPPIYVVDDCVCRPELRSQPHPAAGVGTGFSAWPELGESLTMVDSGALPDAESALALIATGAVAEPVAADQALPEYLRNDVATPPKAV